MRGKLKWLFISATACLLFASSQSYGASVILPIRVGIVNLTLLPLPEAVAYCDAHGLACPAIRDRVR